MWHLRKPTAGYAGQIAAAAIVLVLVGWPVALVLHAAWLGRGANEPALTLREHRAALELQTAALVALTLALALPIGTATALLLFRTDMPGRGVLSLWCVLPALVPIDLCATAWLAGLGPQGLIRSLGVPLELKGLVGAAWVHAMAAVPWIIALVGAAVRLVEAELEEDCLLIAGPLGTIWHVTLRRAAGAVAAAALLVAVLTAGEMAVTDLLQVRTYAETVYVEFAVAGRVADATATAVPGLAVLLILIVLAGRLVARSVPQDVQAIFGRRLQFRLGPARWLAAAGCTLVAAGTLGVPAASLVWRAGLVFPRPDGFRASESRRAEVHGSGFSEERPQRTVGEPVAMQRRVAQQGPRWSARETLRNVVGSVIAIDAKTGEFRAGVAGRELLQSVAVAAAASAVTVPLAWWLAWLARAGHAGRLLTGGTAALLLALPGPVLGAGLALALNRPTRWWAHEPESLGAAVADWLAGVADSPAVLVWLHSVRALPFALAVLWPAVRLVNRSLLEAAEIDGAGPWQRFWNVELPACLPAALAAAAVAAVFSLGEVSGSVIVAPPGIQPLAVRIFTLAHWNVENSLAGICLVLLIVAGTGAAAALASLRWAARRAPV